MRMPSTLRRVNAELQRRYACGLSYEVVDMRGVVLRDETHGPFLRLEVILADGSSFQLDTLEASEILLQATQVH